MLKLQEIRQEKSERLNERINEIEKELYALKNELKLSRKIEKPHMLKALKKEKARILTILTENNKQG
ncbi:MAG: 50S ribosomal protein L29 [Chlamydiae bacterium RIFCSPHIGHO2_12_FULL_27_8]|nr:MAG: 50S ribosomal protein L29 [Chlamydiae bacterium RIFCSPHIGHO2_12_FULL_27_8]OGN64922.1 MAG: 50S ribosomal protein L29 [Chlamydiae bacterium RIFCSPLOWO2_01_FULL_28_7]